MKKRYSFRQISKCEMCGDATKQHKILGQRLNQSQGLNPKAKIGISVSIQKCNNCGLLYSNPQPIPNNLQDHYGTPPEEYWSSNYFKWDPSYFKSQIEDLKSLMVLKSSNAHSTHTHTHTPEQDLKLKALDIGAGLGKSMLSLEAAGFEAYGFEPSKPFYERAIGDMNINKSRLKLGAMEEVEYGSEEFDFITFGAVFEHLYEPAACLEKAMEWLKPGGIIHIEVPSADWLVAKIYNLYYRLRGTNYVSNLSPMHAPFHLHEFTLDSFQEQANMHNFEIVKSRYDVGSIYHLPALLHPLLRFIMKIRKSGLQLTVYLKKN